MTNYHVTIARRMFYAFSVEAENVGDAKILAFNIYRHESENDNLPHHSDDREDDVQVTNVTYNVSDINRKRRDILLPHQSPSGVTVENVPTTYLGKLYKKEKLTKE